MADKNSRLIANKSYLRFTCRTPNQALDFAFSPSSTTIAIIARITVSPRPRQ